MRRHAIGCEGCEPCECGHSECRHRPRFVKTPDGPKRVAWCSEPEHCTEEYGGPEYCLCPEFIPEREAPPEDVGTYAV